MRELGTSGPARCHTPQPQETRSRVHYMAQPGDVTGLAGMTGAPMSCPWKDGPIRQRPGAAPTAATRQLRAHDHAGRTGPDHPNPLKADGVSMAPPAPAPAPAPPPKGGR